MEAIIIGSCTELEDALNDGADIGHLDANGNTPLLTAAVMSNIRGPWKTELLIKKGADVNAADTEGWTPLMYAVGSLDDTRTINLLIDAGASVNERNCWGCTALHFAVVHGNLKMITSLVKAGAEIDDSYDMISRDGISDDTRNHLESLMEEA